ncbi:MAG: hypothetical protein Q9162_006923 [Coniocarpon cinnabarinum]
MADAFTPENVDLTDASDDLIRQVTCYLQEGENEYNGSLGARVSALFVILVVSSAATFFPVLAARVKWFRIPLYFYLFARYFGAGVIVATAFIHLLEPAYEAIGPNTCVGLTGGWSEYTWPPAIALTSVFVIFLMDFAAERYVETKFHYPHHDVDLQKIVVAEDSGNEASNGKHDDHRHLHSGDQDEDLHARAQSASAARNGSTSGNFMEKKLSNENDIERARTTSVANLRHGYVNTDEELEQSFRMQIAAFLILEFGVVFHSVIIGLNLGTAGDEFSTLYPVLVFHQSFEGLGIGARMSAIPFPPRFRWLPWALCSAYGLTTPIAIAIGLGLRTTYNSGSFTANVVSGVFDSTSAGILLWTGLVELLARDFLFDPHRTKDNVRLTFMIVSTLLGTGLMALLAETEYLPDGKLKKTSRARRSESSTAKEHILKDEESRSGHKKSEHILGQRDAGDAGDGLLSLHEPRSQNARHSLSPETTTFAEESLLSYKRLSIGNIGNLSPSSQFDLPRKVALSKLSSRRISRVRHLDAQYKQVHQLLSSTITAGQGNSLLLLGARGAGKSALVESVLDELANDPQNVASNGSSTFHVIRLDGCIQTDDKLALREIWRQLGREMGVVEDDGKSRNYADTLASLLALLSHPTELAPQSQFDMEMQSEQNQRSTAAKDKVSNAVIFLMSEFDAFAARSRQTLLYNLFDVAQSRKAPIAVLGMSTRMDVAEMLEKRVKSRFSHRYIHVPPARNFEAYVDICKHAATVSDDELSYEEQQILRKSPPTTLETWNASVEALFRKEEDNAIPVQLQQVYHTTRSIPTGFSILHLSIATLIPSTSRMCISSGCFPTPVAPLSSAKIDHISSLSSLSIALLVAAARIPLLADTDIVSFPLAYDEYRTLATKARLAASSGGAHVHGGVAGRVWGKEVARGAWEALVDAGLILQADGEAVRGMGPCRVDVALEELEPAVNSNAEKALLRWCREL